MSVFLYQHRPYIERTAEIVKVNSCLTYEDNLIRICQRKDILKEYDFCGEEKTISDIGKESYREITKKDVLESVYKFVNTSITTTTYIPCYKSQLKFR